MNYNLYAYLHNKLHHSGSLGMDNQSDLETGKLFALPKAPHHIGV